jgi:hypothetical protein
MRIRSCFSINLELQAYKEFHGFKYIFPKSHISVENTPPAFSISNELIHLVEHDYFVNPDIHRRNEIPITTGCQFGYTKGFLSSKSFLTATISKSLLSGAIGGLTFYVHDPKDGTIVKKELDRE